MCCERCLIVEPLRFRFLPHFEEVVTSKICLLLTCTANAFKLWQVRDGVDTASGSGLDVLWTMVPHPADISRASGEYTIQTPCLHPYRLFGYDWRLCKACLRQSAIMRKDDGTNMTCLRLGNVQMEPGQSLFGTLVVYIVAALAGEIVR